MDLLFGTGPIAWLQQTLGYGHPFLFRVLSVPGTTWGVLLGIAVALWFWGREDAYAVAGIVVVEVLLNLALNQLLGVPRPDAGGGVVVYQRVTVPAFPSGHVFTAVVIWGLLWARGRVAWWVPVTAAALTALGRVYLGTHYLADILGGLILGAALVYVWGRAWPAVRERLEGVAVRWLLVSAGFVALGAAAGALLLLGGNEHSWRAAGLAFGAAAALPLEYRYVRYDPGDEGAGRRFLQLLVALPLVAAAFVAEQLSDPSAYRLGAALILLAAVWALLLVPALFAGTRLAPSTRLRRSATVRAWGRGAAVVGGVAAAVLLYGAAVEPRLILDVTEEPAPVPGLPVGWEGRTVAVAGDFQVGLWLDNTGMVERVATKLVELRPAAVILLGDFIYHGGPDPGSEVATVVDRLEPLLRSGIPVLAVLGNHDWGMPTREAERQDARAAAVAGALERAGVRVLRNEAVPLRLPGADGPLYAVGIGASYPGNADPAAAVAGVPPGAPRLVAMHNPDAFPDLPPRAAPLAVAGHTHGGQVRLPFTPEWSWLTFSQDDPVHADGWVEGGWGAAGNRLYVNRGVGMSVVPVRVNCPPEITLFRLGAAP